MSNQDLTPVDPVARANMKRCAAEAEARSAANEIMILEKIIDEGWDILIEDGGSWSATWPVKSCWGDL